jgi:hypothetical protein
VASLANSKPVARPGGRRGRKPRTKPSKADCATGPGRPEQVDLARPDLPPFSWSTADADALAEAADMSCVYWRGEERDDWLEQQRAFYERVIAEDSHEAEPALRLHADEGRELLPHWASARRALLIASI